MHMLHVFKERSNLVLQLLKPASKLEIFPVALLRIVLHVRCRRAHLGHRHWNRSAGNVGCKVHKSAKTGYIPCMHAAVLPS